MAALQQSSIRLNGAGSRPARSSRRMAFKAVASSAFEKGNPYLEEMKQTAKYIAKRGKGILARWVLLLMYTLAVM
jgi:hypothetical protein